jgi:hypothetical protein
VARKLGVEDHGILLGVESGVASNGRQLQYVTMRLDDLYEGNQTAGDDFAEFKHLLKGLVKRARCQ